METKLSGDGYPKEVINRVMEFLKEYRLIDDRVYTENFIRMNQEKKSCRQIAFELQQKGVDRQDISRILEGSAQDDLAAARNLLKNAFELQIFLISKRKIAWGRIWEDGAFPMT